MGGGAILGAAHIGVLRALEERKIQIGSITGTSIGAFIAALYAFGVSPHEIEEKITDLKEGYDAAKDILRKEEINA